MPTGYKVVKKYGERYYSCSFSKTTDIGIVEYIIGQTSVPQAGQGPLCIYQKKEQAIDWIDEWIGTDESIRAKYEILKCEYVESDAEYIFIVDRNILPTSATLYNQTHKSQLPAGTILADSITPISTVRWE